jgi:hypothetical protein
MRVRMLAPTVLAGVLVAAAPLPAHADGCPDRDFAATADNEAQVATALVCEMNARRAAANLPPLRSEAHLASSARYHADDMAFFRYFGHRRQGGPALVTRIGATGYFDGVSAATYTENLADAPEGRATAAEVVDAWMQSDHHRANLLYEPFREAGIAIELVSPDPAFYPDLPSALFVVDYGRRYDRHRTRCRRHTSAEGPRRICKRHTPRSARS